MLGTFPKGTHVGQIQTQGAWKKKLVPKVICPNCWQSFRPEDVLFIAKHQDLVGDDIAGTNEFLRFKPEHFTTKGEAIDPKGYKTSDMACPRCHLQVAESLIEVAPLFISMIGAPASGKSYLLTTMTWELRRLLPKAWLIYSDADPVANSALHEYEQALFLNPNPDRPTEIRKTQRDDPRLHRTAIIEGAPIRFPVPFQFSLWPGPEHPRYAYASQIGRVVVIYDNAGEDFLPGAEEGNSAVVQHLARSQILLALFDPTQDPRFRAQCSSDDPQLAHGLRPGADKPVVLLRQETILREAAVRVRRYLGMSQDQRLRKPLVVVVPKFDIWADQAGVDIETEPYIDGDEDNPMRMDLRRVEATSKILRDLFRELCPEFVATAENLSEVVRYIPVSSLGTSPELVRRAKQTFYGIRPKDIKPKWVSVPLTYCLCKWARGLIDSTNGSG